MKGKKMKAIPPLVTHEGYIYKISHSKKLKKVYFKLIGKDFFIIKEKMIKVIKECII